MPGWNYPKTINYPDGTVVALTRFRVWFRSHFEGTATKDGRSATGDSSHDPMLAAANAVNALAKQTGMPVAKL